MLRDLLGEDAVVVERGLEPLEPHLEVVIVLEVGLRELFEGREARARVRLGERDVEADHADLVPVEELANHERHLVAAPRPAALGAEALLVDVEDHHARVERLRHEEPQPRVVAPELHLLHEAVFRPARLVDEEREHHRQPGRDANPGVGAETRYPAFGKFHGLVGRRGSRFCRMIPQGVPGRRELRFGIWRRRRSKTKAAMGR